MHLQGPVILLKFDPNHQFVSPCDHEIWWMTSKNNREHLLHFVYHLKSIGEFKLKLESGNTRFGSKLAIFCPVWPCNLMDDLGKQQDTSSILHQAFCIISKPFVNSTRVTVRKRPIWVKIDVFVCPVWLWNLTWPWKTIRYLFYAASGFVHHFVAIGEIKL